MTTRTSTSTSTSTSDLVRGDLEESLVDTSTSTSATRLLRGIQLPSPGLWAIDPGHAEVAFVGRHMMFTKVRGRLADVKGTVMIAEDPADSFVNVVIGMASVSSGDSARDDHIRSAELFDVERFPEATFRSRSVSWQGDEGVARGDLTIHGVSQPVALDVVFDGYARDPWGGDRAMFSARTRVNREDFGLTWNMVLEAGGLLVSKEIDIEISLETVLEP